MNDQRFFITLEYFKSIHPLSKALKSFIKEKSKVKSYKKGEIISQSGDICNKLMIISKGMVRGYFVYNKKEINTWISFDNEMFTSISGFFRNEKSLENIQAIEDTVVEYLEYADIHKCLKFFKESNVINRVLMEEYYISAENRAFMSRIPSAEDRYLFYLKNNKVELLNRVPKKHLASLLNMQPETLSRVIKKIKLTKSKFK
jgi:CRP-like cAMP-binding protein